jgi:hypothetical protein
MKKVVMALLVAVITIMGIGSSASASNYYYTNQTFYDADVGNIAVFNYRDSNSYHHIYTQVQNHGWKDASAVVNLYKQLPDGSWTLVGSQKSDLDSKKVRTYIWSVGGSAVKTWRVQVKLYSKQTGNLLFNQYTSKFVH